MQTNNIENVTIRTKMMGIVETGTLMRMLLCTQTMCENVTHSINNVVQYYSLN